MILDIVHYGSPVLRKRSTVVPAVTKDLLRLASDMLETMYAAKGVGLAAQQVGRLESLCVIDVPPDCENEEDRGFNARVAMPLVMFNPSIVASSGEQDGSEGCLSFPKIGCNVKRAGEVTVCYIAPDGSQKVETVRGFLARAVQHETDHLNGILFVDRADAKSVEKASGKLKKLAKANGGRM